MNRERLDEPAHEECPRHNEPKTDQRNLAKLAQPRLIDDPYGGSIDINITVFLKRNHLYLSILIHIVLFLNNPFIFLSFLLFGHHANHNYL